MDGLSLFIGFVILIIILKLLTRCPYCGESTKMPFTKKCSACHEWFDTDSDYSPPKYHESPKKYDTTSIFNDITEQSICPYCRAEIDKKALKCKHCGEWLKAKESESLVPSNESKNLVMENGKWVKK